MFKFLWVNITNLDTPKAATKLELLEVQQTGLWSLSDFHWLSIQRCHSQRRQQDCLYFLGLIGGTTNRSQIYCAAQGAKVRKAGNTNWRGRFSKVDLLTRVACFVKKWIMFSISKVADLNKLVQGGQLYWAFPFSSCFLVQLLLLASVTVTVPKTKNARQSVLWLSGHFVVE